jgi:hypothetical protein
MWYSASFYEYWNEFEVKDDSLACLHSVGNQKTLISHQLLCLLCCHITLIIWIIKLLLHIALRCVLWIVSIWRTCRLQCVVLIRLRSSTNDIEKCTIIEVTFKFITIRKQQIDEQISRPLRMYYLRLLINPFQALSLLNLVKKQSHIRWKLTCVEQYISEEIHILNVLRF